MFSASSFAQDLAKAPQPKTHTRWISPENPTGAKGKGGLTNKGAKGNAFFIVPPGQKQVLFDVTAGRNQTQISERKGLEIF